MAEEIAFVIKIDGQDRAINSLKDLKKAKKDATDAFIKGDKDAAKALAELTDKTEDLADASRSLKGSGVESAASSFSLLGDGLKNLDLDKVKTGFSGLGSAMKAIPLLLIVEGITYLVTNFEELSKGSGILATVLRSVGDVIDWLVDGFTDLIGVTSESSRAIEEQGEAMVKANEKTQEALTETTASFDRQLAVAKAAGKSTIEIEQAKQQAIIDTNVQIAKGIEAQVRAGGVFTDEMQKQLSGSLSAIKNSKVAEYVATETDNKLKQEQYKKHLDKQKELLDAANAQKLLDLQKAKQDEDAINLQEQALIDKNNFLINESKRVQDQLNKDEQAAFAFRNELAKNAAAEEIVTAQATAQQKLDIQMASLNAASQIVNLVGQLANKNKAVQKAGLIAESALGIAKMIISNKAANIAALATPQAIATSGASAVPVIAMNNVTTGLGIAASIIATNKALQSLGGGSTSAPSVGGGGFSAAGGSSAVPNVTPPSTQPSTLLDANGQPINSNKPQTFRVINVESDTTRVQEDVKRVRNQATI